MRDASGPPVTPNGTRTPEIVVVGSGFGGLTVAIYLLRAGFDRITILEKSTALGGVWRENTYPGAACDVPSPLYSISLEPNPDWPERFSAQPDILRYLGDVADRNGLRERIRFGVEVATQRFDDTERRWHLTTTDGVTIECDVVIDAVGQLSRPRIPVIPGADTFAGSAFHSAQWDHTVDPAGRRVAVVGTGASAIQFVPAIAPRAGHVTVFQRTPPWVLRKKNWTYPAPLRALFRAVPATRLAERLSVWITTEFVSAAMVDVPVIRRFLRNRALANLDDAITDRAQRAALIPDYDPGCKRVLFSSDWYPTLVRPDVDVVSEAITGIEPTGIRTADGTLHEADVIIYGTGFAASDLLAPLDIRGENGRRLADEWADGAHAHLGITVPGFPNMFVVYGPNTNLGGGSIVYMLEAQARYIVAALRTVAHRPGRTVAVRPEVEAAFNERIQTKLRRAVWTRCSSWYQDASGRIVNNWPGLVAAYRLATRRFDPADHLVVDRDRPELSPAARPADSAPPSPPGRHDSGVTGSGVTGSGVTGSGVADFGVTDER